MSLSQVCMDGILWNVLTGHNPKYALEEGQGLTIRNVSLQDDGVYTCRAEVDTDGRYDERKITVNVHGKFKKHLYSCWGRLVDARV